MVLHIAVTPDVENSAKDRKTGFDIGFDFALYGLIPDTKNKDVLDGYCYKKNMGGSRKKTTYFTRKWLTLRLHAFERGLHYDLVNVTPYALEHLYGVENGVCPITLQPMTQGTLTETDASYDRILNHYGYLPGNIKVMSRLANDAKGYKSPDEIAAIAHSKTRYEGLDAGAWQRMCLLARQAELIFESQEQWSKYANRSDSIIIKEIIERLTDPRIDDEDGLDFHTDCLAAGVKDTKVAKEIARYLAKLRRKRDVASGSIPDLQTLVNRSLSVRGILTKLEKMIQFDRVANCYREHYQCHAQLVNGAEVTKERVRHLYRY